MKKRKLLWHDDKYKSFAYNSKSQNGYWIDKNLLDTFDINGLPLTLGHFPTLSTAKKVCQFMEDNRI